MRFFIVITFIGLFIGSCVNKDNLQKTIAEGYILHSGTKKPLDSVKVYLYDGLPNSSRGSNRIDSALTDSTGFFHIELYCEEPVLYPFKQGYSFEYAIQGAVIGIVPLNIGKNTNLRFELDAWAYFKPSCIIGSECQLTDTVWYGEGSIINPPLNPYVGGHFMGNGPHKLIYWDGFEGWLAKGDKYFYYWLKYQIHGVWHERVDSVYIPSFTTYTDTIYY